MSVPLLYRSRRVLPAALIASLLLALAACGNDDSVQRLEVPADGGTPVAPELQGLGDWWNAEPFTLEEQQAQGRVVLLDFWTYTCVNCIRTLPYLQAWDERYREHGLTILGLHAPEFEFEREPSNVEAAIERLGIEYPVAQDNDFTTWRAYENRYWPAKYLVGTDGRLRYVHFGEGAYAETEDAIRGALEAAGRDLDGVERIDLAPPPRETGIGGEQTRELYGGYERNFATGGQYAGQDEYYLAADRVARYEDDGTREQGHWYLQGWWRNTREAIVHAQPDEALADYIAVPFAARSVNVVLSFDGGEPFEVVVEIDGRAPTPEEAGADLTIDDGGRATVRVTEAKMYRLLELPAFGEHELRLRSASDRLAIFAFTFGSYTEGA